MQKVTIDIPNVPLNECLQRLPSMDTLQKNTKHDKKLHRHRKWPSRHGKVLLDIVKLLNLRGIRCPWRLVLCPEIYSTMSWDTFTTSRDTVTIYYETFNMATNQININTITCISRPILGKMYCLGKLHI
jgi:hypothetical protein